MTTIRPAQAGDCGAVAAMVVELAGLFGVRSGTTPELLRTEAFGSRPSIAILVAEEENGALAGYLVHQDTFSTWRGATGVFIVDLFVRPDRRSDGIGVRLMEEAARLGRARGARFMRLDIDEANEGGARFYRRLGFRPLEHDRFLVLDEPGFEALSAG